MKFKSMLTYVGFLFVAVFVAGCVKTAYSPHVHKALRVNEPMFEIRAVKLSDSTVRLSFITDPMLRTADPNIRWVEAAIGPDASSLTDTITFNIGFAGAPGVDATVHVIGDAAWDTRGAKLSKSAVIDMSVVTATSHLIFRHELEYSTAVPMELEPFTMARADTLIDIGAMARRIYVPPGEYLPSSEVFRIIVTDEKGTVVYRSDAGRAFLSVVSTVEPQTPNQMQRYSIPWNGHDLRGNKVNDGTFRAEMLIPAVPKSYNAKIEFQWPPR
ncbi:MAG: hypothetical protein HQ472_06220 [Ignavibacteria bacterium]|nr:hypothetical protein [Ignavibacteria bacterium]